MKAVVLVSGGLDSATTLAIAVHEGYDCHALSFRYGQRHDAELEAARTVCSRQGTRKHRILTIELGSFGGSALTDHTIEVPLEPVKGIPITYVPARNTIFLSFAIGYAEVINARHIFIGVNAVDYSGYPDCRPEYIHAFEAMANLATRASVEGAAFRIHTPLITLSKAEIIQLGTRLGVDYSSTVSCYQADSEGLACGICEACRIRRNGFTSAAIHDPTRYRP